MAMQLGKIPRTAEVYTREEVDRELAKKADNGPVASPLEMVGENGVMYRVGVDASGQFYARPAYTRPADPEDDEGVVELEGVTQEDGTTNVDGETAEDGTLTVEA